MRRVFGFTLIELMITVAIIAVLAAIALPSYKEYVKRGVRSQGQQYLMDLAQREEQYFLDQRAYTATIGAGGINVPLPNTITGKYGAAVVTVVNPATGPSTFSITLTPVAGTVVEGDGTLIINNLQQRWRSLNAASAAPGGGDCFWEDTRCKPS